MKFMTQSIVTVILVFVDFCSLQFLSMVFKRIKE